MNLNDLKITLNGQPVVRSDSFPDTRSKNQKKKDRKEYFKQKRKIRGSLTIELPMEKPWHERIVVKESK
jgi:hypothetical protein